MTSTPGNGSGIERRRKRIRLDHNEDLPTRLQSVGAVGTREDRGTEPGGRTSGPAWSHARSRPPGPARKHTAIRRPHRGAEWPPTRSPERCPRIPNKHADGLRNFRTFGATRLRFTVKFE